MDNGEAHTRRGAELLIEHCYALGRDRPSATERLERVVGGQLARLLVGALAGGRRSRSVLGDRAA